MKFFISAPSNLVHLSGQYLQPNFNRLHHRILQLLLNIFSIHMPPLLYTTNSFSEWEALIPSVYDDAKYCGEHLLYLWTVSAIWMFASLHTQAANIRLTASTKPVSQHPFLVLIHRWIWTAKCTATCNKNISEIHTNQVYETENAMMRLQHITASV